MTGGNRDTTLKGHTQNLTCTGPRTKAEFERTQPANLRQSLSEAGVPAAHPGNIDTGKSHYWELFLLCGHWYC